MSASPFPAVAAQPDLAAQEHRTLDFWRERAIFAKLRAQNAGGPHWSFIDGPITANNPMGVHHAWGRAYKDAFQRYHAMLGHDQRWQNGFDCQGLWVEVNVERELGFTSKKDIESFGIADFVRLCKQRVLTYAAVQTEQSIRLGYWMDWNDPDELRRLRDLLEQDPAQTVTVDGPNGPVTDTVEMLVGRLGLPEMGGSYFTFSNENNDLIWGFLAECHRRGWLYKGIDSMPWCARCGTGMSQMEMNEGYQDREDPGLTVRFPLLERPGEALLVWTTTPWTMTANVAAAVGADLDYVLVEQGEDRYWVGKGRPQVGRPGPLQGPRGAQGRRPRGLALPRPVRRPGGPGAGLRGRSGRAGCLTLRAPRHRLGRGRRGGGHEHRPHRARVAARRTSGSASSWGCRSSRRWTRPATTSTASAPSRAWTRRPSRPRSSRRSRRAASTTTWSPTRTATRTAGAAARRSSSASWTSGTSPWARSTTCPASS